MTLDSNLPQGVLPLPATTKKPWSLFEDITRPIADPQPPSFFILSLIQTLGRDACLARRNALQLYQIVSQARDICDAINELVLMVLLSEDVEIVISASHKYEEMLTTLKE